MAWKVERTLQADRDLDLLFDHLLRSSPDFGDDMPRALGQAGSRLRGIGLGIRSLASAPHRGTRPPEIGGNVRHVTKDSVIYDFQLDEETETIRLLAIFFSGQDHHTHIRRRLLSDDNE